VFINVCDGKIAGCTGYSNIIADCTECSTILIVVYSVTMPGRAGCTGYSIVKVFINVFFLMYRAQGEKISFLIMFLSIYTTVK
jgi:hypothetical protein